MTRLIPSARLLVAALVIALAASGTAIGAKLITSKQIKNGTIKTKDLSKKTRAALKGNAGPQGPQGPQGLPGPAGTPGQKGDEGPAGPGTYAVQSTQLTANNPISNDSATPTSFNTIELAGPATYLVTMSGSMFTDTDSCGVFSQIYVDETPLAGQAELGTSTADGTYAEESYSVQRMIAIPDGTSTVELRGYRFSGAGDCTVFSEVTTGLRIDDASGAQTASVLKQRRTTGAR